MIDSAIFAGSFDPFTLGHYDIVARASAQFGKVIVAVANTGRKSYAFDLETRLSVVRASVSDISNVEVRPFGGLLVDFMRADGVRYFVRGLRTCADFEYERGLYAVYKSQYPEVEGCYYMADGGAAYISSSYVREILALGGDISKYVRPAAAEIIMRR